VPIHTFIINRRQSGQALVAIMQSQLGLAQEDALECVRERGVRLAGNLCTDVNRRVRSGQRVHVTFNPKQAPRKKPRREKRPEPVELPPDAKGITVRFVDEHILVVEKPAGLTTMRHAEEAAEFGQRAKRFLPSTVVDFLPAVLAARGAKPKGRVRAVHRLDKETSGLVVFALTPLAERVLGKQFRGHAVGRHYLALVRGQARDGRIESYLVRDRGDGRRGSGPTGEGQRAVTHVRVIEQLGNFAHVECRLETGRTHQVRIHLGEQGTPLCGERIYDRALNGQPLPDTSGAVRPMLHAASLAFNHPATGKPMAWESPIPDDMYRLLRGMRKARPAANPQAGDQ
jgi:23S rRNA pseudouridine1911/1915/1917 synthase